VSDGTTFKVGLDVSEFRTGEKEINKTTARISSSLKSMGKVVEDLTTVGKSGKSWADSVAPSEKQSI